MPLALRLMLAMTELLGWEVAFEQLDPQTKRLAASKNVSCDLCSTAQNRRITTGVRPRESYQPSFRDSRERLATAHTRPERLFQKSPAIGLVMSEASLGHINLSDGHHRLKLIETAGRGRSL
jgi:hypothetical protein